MSFLLLLLVVANVVFIVVMIYQGRKIAKVENKLRYTEACLEREEGNNRRMLEAIDAQRHSGGEDK
jgi:cell division protein FtsL